MRILLYLPVVTPWWFSNIIVPIIRALAHSHEVHVMVPPTWHGTGISKGQAGDIETLPHVHWHLLNGPDHPALRVDASDRDEVIDFVAALAPDLTLCRSADTKTPALFPGTVRYIMECGAPPFIIAPGGVVLKTGLFDHGFVPGFTREIAAQLDAIADELWPDMLARINLPRKESFLKDSQLEASVRAGKKLIALPLEYEHPENFFGQHHAFENNAAMINAAADAVGEDAVLLVTHHPLSELYGDTSAADAAIMRRAGRVKLLGRSGPPDLFGGNVTRAMMRHCDAAILGNSKSWSFAAAFGTPAARLSPWQSADWIGAYNTIGALMDDLKTGQVTRPDPILTRRWFAHHMLNCAVDPLDPGFCAQEIVERVFEPVDPARWVDALARYRTLRPDRVKRAPPHLQDIMVEEKIYV